MLRALPVQPEQLLQRYYTAHASADAELNALIGSVQGAVRQRLAAKSVRAEDLEDLYGEAVGRLVGATRRSRDQRERRIGNYLNYALTVADSVFEDYLRRLRPNWCRLKRRVLYLLDGKAGGSLFARWRLQSDWLGGFLRWHGHPFRFTARYRALCETPETFCREALQDQNPDQIPLPELLALLFRWTETPLEINALTTHLAALQQLQEPTRLSLETAATEEDRALAELLPLALTDVAEQVIEALSGEQFRAHLWQILCELPLRQRFALLLGLSREELLLLGTATRLAESLALPLAEFADVWPALPLSDSEIAVRLEITPKQVSNLRKCARERTLRWLNRSAGSKL